MWIQFFICRDETSFAWGSFCEYFLNEYAEHNALQSLLLRCIIQASTRNRIIRQRIGNISLFKYYLKSIFEYKILKYKSVKHSMCTSLLIPWHHKYLNRPSLVSRFSEVLMLFYSRASRAWNFPWQASLVLVAKIQILTPWTQLLSLFLNLFFFYSTHMKRIFSLYFPMRS